MPLHTAERIKNLRLKNHMTQSELARHLYVARSSVNAWEMATTIPTSEKLVRLCEVFHISADYILGISSKERILLNSYSEKEKLILYQMLNYFDEAHEAKAAEKKEKKSRTPGNNSD